MADPNDQYLEAFAGWLRELADDARALAAALEVDAAPEATRRGCAVALNYLFKSVDLIPDGIEDLGFLDDAFVARIAAEAALEASPEARELPELRVLARLAEEAALVREFLGDAAARLATYVAALDSVAVRGRTADLVLGDAAARAALVGEVRAWAESYRAPTFARDEKNLVKLRAFLDVKLPI
jgi:uncharacterized membrane protein YkvA (DUF1232 family)